jgi:NodT family efflux transporter outer membrane factor (OMF) lipoprotein
MFSLKTPFWNSQEYLPKQMKPQQLSPHEPLFSESTRRTIDESVQCAKTSLPTLAAVAVAIASSVVLMLSGCANSSGIASVAKPIAPASVGLGASGTAMPALTADWWHSFGDSTLDSLVDKALVGSPNLRVAQARLARADALIANARSADGLHINGEADVTPQRFTATSIYPPPLGGGHYVVANAQLTGSYEFDFFGRNRAAIEAAVGSQRAAQADVAAARIALASNVARNYVQLGRLFAQREVAARSLKQRDDILSLIKQRVEGGLDTTVEQRQGEGALPESRQQIEVLDEQIMLTRHILAALTAQAPDAFDTLVVPLNTVQAVPLPSSVPADLLGRRADITAARWRVEAATSDVKSAKADFYPNINLTGFAGLSSIGLNHLFKTDSEQYGIGPAIHLPIFDQGHLRANLSGKTADLDAAIESYNGAVIDAVHDVADQIGSLRSIARQQVQEESAQAAAESAYDLATQRYKAGLGTYLTVLNAETTVLTQRRQATDLKARAIDQQITLIRALGGGYVADPELAARSVPATPAQ